MVMTVAEALYLLVEKESRAASGYVYEFQIFEAFIRLIPVSMNGF